MSKKNSSDTNGNRTCNILACSIVPQPTALWRAPKEIIPKLIMEWTPPERKKRGSPRKTWIEGVQAAMATRNLEPDQWRNRNGVWFPEDGDSRYEIG